MLLSDIGRVDVTITEVNDAPVASDDPVTTAEDTQLELLAADLIANDIKGPANESGQTLTLESVGNAVNGTVEMNAGVITFTPDENFNGDASFTYTVFDDGTTNGDPEHLSDTGTVQITVTAVNDDPVAVGDRKTRSKNTPLTFPSSDLTANDTDDDVDDEITVTSVAEATALGGTAVLNNDGVITYTPPVNHVGGDDSFTYTISDGNEGTDTATVTMPVAQVGYYDVALNNGNATQVAPITTAGMDAVNIGDMTTANLSLIDVLFVQNPSNFAYSMELVNNLAKVHAFVANGGVLIFHDRHVSPEATTTVGEPNAAADFSGSTCRHSKRAR